MDQTTQFRLAVDLLTRLDIEVRSEHLSGGGCAMCKVRGGRVFFIDLDLPQALQVESLITALASLPIPDDVYIVPALRKQIEQADTKGETGEKTE